MQIQRIIASVQGIGSAIVGATRGFISGRAVTIQTPTERDDRTNRFFLPELTTYVIADSLSLGPITTLGVAAGMMVASLAMNEGFRSAFSMPVAPPPSDLDKALGLWKTLAPQVATLPLTVDRTYHSDTIRFLKKLTSTAEYANEKTRGILAYRILTICNAMAQNSELKNAILIMMSDSLVSCDDHVIAALDTIEILIATHTLEQDETLDEHGLRKAAKGFLLLDMITAEAEAHINKPCLFAPDPLEVLLAFRIRLKDMLNLPVETKHMRFRDLANISNEDIDAIGIKLLRECTDERLDAYLKTWGPWTTFKRRTALLPYDKLPKAACKKERTCCIMQTPTKQPVEYLGNIYDYKTFRRCYIKDGIDPFTRLPIELDKLMKI